ncbi:MAG: hypothetical protein HY684_07675 [Chloroflexi bacterium]|nr:hypothetical protein [Chloroflexota bacterium]
MTSRPEASVQPHPEQASPEAPGWARLRTLLARGGPAWLSYAFYAALSLVILAPFLAPGYILTLDIPLGPAESLNDGAYVINEWWVSPSIHLAYLFQLVRAVVPLWLVQKVGFFLVFFLAGVGAHRLARSAGIAAYFAGLLYVLNPFVYVRFLAGQWWLLAAYALTPFAVQAFLNLLAMAPRSPEGRPAQRLGAGPALSGARGRWLLVKLGLTAPSAGAALRVAVLATLTGLLYAHGYALLLLIFLVFLLVYLVKASAKGAFLRWAGRNLGFAALVALGLNIFWLVPLLTNHENIVNATSQLDLVFFAPRSTSNLSVVFEIAAMYGFWRGGYIYPKDNLPVWWLLFAFILFLAVLGALAHWQEPKEEASSGFRRKQAPRGWGASPMVVGFGLVGAVGLVLTIGASMSATAVLLEKLGEMVPALRGFRDSQKFVALLCLSYAILGALGVAELRRALEGHLRRVWRATLRGGLAAALVTPLAYSYGMFGFFGQVQVTDFPRSWYEVNEQLQQDPDDVWVLVLPWHLYMDYRWLPDRDKRLASPAHLFFAKPVYAGDNVEAGAIYSQSTSPASHYIEALIKEGGSHDNLGNLLTPLNVRYILLLHEVDYSSYDFLYRQRDMEVQLQRDDLTLFRNKAPAARAYAVQQAPPSPPPATSKQQSQDTSAAPLAAALAAMGQTRLESLAVQPDGPWRWRVAGAPRPYVTFPVPPKAGFTSWTFNGEPPLRQAGYLPVWRSSLGGGVIVYERFYRVLLPSYIASGVVVLLVIALAVALRRAGSAVASG